MKLIISDCSREKVYHLTGCPHASRITDRHRMDITPARANVLGYRKCKCCGNLKGTIRALTSSLETLGAGRKMTITYQKKTDTIYMRTAIGFWKAFWKDDAGLILYHLNHYDLGKTDEELSWAPFHRQKDVPPTMSLDKLLVYIEEHDRAKQIIAEDYKKLPQRTKKQKKYYRIAERQDKRRQVRRVFDILESLEAERRAKEGSLCMAAY